MTSRALRHSGSGTRITLEIHAQMTTLCACIICKVLQDIYILIDTHAGQMMHAHILYKRL